MKKIIRRITTQALKSAKSFPLSLLSVLSLPHLLVGWYKCVTESDQIVRAQDIQ